MSNQRWVTLATNDSYGLGALVLAHSLRRVGSAYPAVVLITPSVTEAMRERLRAVFSEVVIVDVLDSRDAAHLALLQRPELGITFTKIHCWNLTQYEKCVFLDADTLVIQNCDELFEREELSAAPDVGWPDCFNSGVFVFRPSADTFSNLITFAAERGSFDGGDQGLLNSYFSDWAQGDNKKRLPFLYNVTSAAFYSYLPALKHFGQNLKIIHFIGAIKPWLQQYNWESRSVEAPEHLRNFLQIWWDLFVADVHAQLDTTMTGVAGNLARVVPGAPLQREAVDELTRRQGWEAGNIDYMGADSFDNIWAKISQTLSQPPATQPEQSSEQQSESVPQQPGDPVAVEANMEVVEAVAEKQSVLPTPEKEDLAPSVEKNETEVTTSPESEVSKSTESKVPKPAESEVLKSAETEVSKLPESEVSKSAETEVPKSAEIEVSKLAESEVPKSSETEVPKSAESEVPKSAESKAAEPAASVTEEVPTPTPKEPEPAEVPVPASEASEPSSKVEEPIPIPAEIAAEIPATVDVVVPVESSSPANLKEKSEQAEIPVAALEALKIDEPLTETPLPVTVVEQSTVPEPAAEPVSEPVPEPVSEPVLEPVPDPVPITPAVAEPVPVAVASAEPAAASVEPASPPEAPAAKPEISSDSPPLANTPSKEEIPVAPAAKSTEEAAQETRL